MVYYYFILKYIFKIHNKRCTLSPSSGQRWVVSVKSRGFGEKAVSGGWTGFDGFELESNRKRRLHRGNTAEVTKPNSVTVDLGSGGGGVLGLTIIKNRLTENFRSETCEIIRARLIFF